MTAIEVQRATDIGRRTAALALQKLVPELVAFTLDVKQAHWAATGPAFLAFHALTDELAADARKYADRAAERAMALGLSGDAKPQAVAAETSRTPAKPVTDHAAMTELIEIIEEVTAATWPLAFELERADPVAHDVTVGLLEGLEKYRAMLRAQLEGRHPLPIGHRGSSSDAFSTPSEISPRQPWR